jgi:hypothetical protein
MNRAKTRLTRFAGALLVSACCSCAETAPVTPSPPSLPSLPSVAGTYTLGLTRCSLSAEGPSERPMVFVCSSQNKWMLSQVDGDVTGTAVGLCAPFNWSGALTGKVTVAGTIEITTLTYRDSSSHSAIQTLTLSGSGVVDEAGFTGKFAGAYTSAAVFGSATGPVSSCESSQMPFRFSRQQ